MKLSIGLTAALSSFAAAAQQAAEVYILPAPESAAPLNVSPSLARLLLLQRVATNGKGPSTRDIPDGISPEEAVTVINTFNKEPESLFGDSDHDAPSQLVIMLEDLTEAQIKELGSAFQKKPSFTITNPPSASAHEKLIKNDFYNAGVTQDHECSLDDVINPFAKACWSGKSTVAKYNVAKDAKIVKNLVSQISRLNALAASGEMETTLVLLPSNSGANPTNQWSDKPQELRRRQAETVISSAEDTAESAVPTSPAADAPVLFKSTASIPSCFKSEDDCNAGTGSCSGHGSCVNKYAKRDGKDACFSCQCENSVTEGGSVNRWVGPACSKQDISVEFWLFAGFTLFMVAIVGGSISLLYSVGDEKLPGVIGAGVSRSK